MTEISNLETLSSVRAKINLALQFAEENTSTIAPDYASIAEFEAAVTAGLVRDDGKAVTAGGVVYVAETGAAIDGIPAGYRPANYVYTRAEIEAATFDIAPGVNCIWVDETGFALPFLRVDLATDLIGGDGSTWQKAGISVTDALALGTDVANSLPFALKIQSANIQTRAEFVTYQSTRTFLEGAWVQVAGLTYLFDDASTAISDLPGWKPVGNIYPDHFGENTSPGTTDMTAEIQDAIDYAATFGGGAAFGAGAEVWFQAAIYKTVGGIIINQSGVSLRGTGSNSTQIRNSSATATTFAMRADDVTTGTQLSRCHVYDMQFYCTATDPTAGSAIAFSRATQCTVQGCVFINSYRGVELFGCDESVKILDCEFVQGSNTTSLHSGSTGIAVLRLEVDSGVAGAIQDAVDSKWYLSCFSVNVDNCNIRSNAYGNQHNMIVGACDGLYVSNSHIGFATGASVLISAQQANLGMNNMMFSNVIFDPMESVGNDNCVLVDTSLGPAGNVLVDLSFVGCNFAGADDTCVKITAPVQRPKFVGCQFKTARNYGLMLSNASIADAVITGNTFWDQDIGVASAASLFLNAGNGAIVNGNCFKTGSRAIQITTVFERANIGDNTFASISGNCIFLASGHMDNHLISGSNIITESTSVASASSLQLPPGRDVFTITGTTTVNGIRTATPTSSYTGRVVTLIFDGALTVVNSAGFRLNGSVNFTTAAGSTLTMACYSSVWYEIGRCA